MPTHQPVRFFCREDWVQPIEHQLNNYRLTKSFDAEEQPCLEGVRFIVTKRQQQFLKQRQRDQIAREKTKQLEHQMYERTVRQTRLALARQKGRADALKEDGIKPQEQQQQPKQKPLAKATKSGRKPQNRKPPQR